jgi:DNA polymerase-3 subunit delta'
MKPVVGHVRARARLAQAVSDDHTASAYLLVGPAGIGKRLAADHFAARLLCAEPDGDEPCGTCGQCTRVAAGTHADLRVVSRDQDRRDIRTEQARELTRWLGLRPLMGRRKVAIIDGADELNEHGQNAILKTLEEPPGAAVLVLVAASPFLLLPTLRSRCQRVRFDPLSADEVREVLVAHEVPTAALELLVARAAGSPGRALTLADEADGELRTRLLARLAELGRATAADLSALAQAAGRGNLAVALEVVLSWYRDLLRVCIEPGAGDLQNPDVAGPLAAAASHRTPGSIVAQLEEVCGTIDDVERNANRVLAIETLLLRLRRLEEADAGGSWTTAR